MNAKSLLYRVAPSPRGYSHRSADSHHRSKQPQCAVATAEELMSLLILLFCFVLCYVDVISFNHNLSLELCFVLAFYLCEYDLYKRPSLPFGFSY